MLNSKFDQFATHPGLDFYPVELRERIDTTIDAIYTPINNGVYRTGFASTQSAYDMAVTELFEHLERWNTVLEEQPYLCGDRITLADWCMFTTLFRFDVAYHGLFKCNLKRIADYPNLQRYLETLYNGSSAKDVSSIEHVKQLYYAGLPELNPSRIVPKGPESRFASGGPNALA